MMKFEYRGIHKLKNIYMHIGGIFAILFFTAVAVFFWIGSTQIPVSEPNLGFLDNPQYTPICFGVWFIVFSWACGSMFLNFNPTVWTDERGLTITVFLFFKTFIPWSDLIDSREIMFGYVLVRARKITPFHRMFGWIYSQTFSPAFLIGPGIDDRETLLRQIRLHTHSKPVIVV